ncbi:LolA-like outer membrane lipoprotein chaperone [Campylobacter mucosalis]|uniref:LolA-like outer membrane lipoprotein chaperone n=1 Tax=Campylobacter mucosalis TaxID=202 RepID=UPI00146FD8AD|nr:LolA-like outer membrane lipoprotein chaperone [Campylobacter mucosalis]
MKKILLIFAFCVASFASELNFNTIESDFTQVVNSKESKVTYTGKFYATSDNNALWIYYSPTPKKIYFSATHVVVVEDELEQAVVSKLENTPNLAQILANAKKITPTLYKAVYDDVEYFINTKNGLPQSIDYQDKLDNKIKITLNNTIKDKSIPANLLTPNVPKGYDIITQ